MKRGRREADSRGVFLDQASNSYWSAFPLVMVALHRLFSTNNTETSGAATCYTGKKLISPRCWSSSVEKIRWGEGGEEREGGGKTVRDPRWSRTLMPYFTVAPKQSPRDAKRPAGLPKDRFSDLPRDQISTLFFSLFPPRLILLPLLSPLLSFLFSLSLCF